MNKGCEEFLLVTSEHLPEIVDTVELVLVRGSGLGFHGAESFAATAAKYSDRSADFFSLSPFSSNYKIPVALPQPL